MPVPDITGQPAWVVVILAVLAVASTLGVAWLTSRSRKSATADRAEQATLPESGQDATVVVIQSALDHLAKVAEREAVESTQAREKVEELRQALQDTKSDLVEALRRAEQAEALLTACREHARLLTIEAFRKGDKDA